MLTMAAHFLGSAGLVFFLAGAGTTGLYFLTAWYGTRSRLARVLDAWGMLWLFMAVLGAALLAAAEALRLASG